ncbi:IS5 family transposase [Streptomyces sp. NPDC052095]|uniref:IS5 family transposase n=1 Tax=unclassified Streptomyces TaxID=2593676 RepID=UPI00344DFDDC
MARFDVTDAEWALIEGHLPVAATGPLPRRVRDQFNGILWWFRAGTGWRDVPERYGPWSTVYSRFNAWSKAGVFQALMEALIAEAAGRGRVGLELVSVDSTVVRAHHESAGLAVAGETLDALEQALTEEKGGSAGPAGPGPAGDTPQAAPGTGSADRAGRDPAAARRRRGTRAKAAGLGRSRGGLSSKIHTAVDASGLPLVFVLTPGQTGDSPQFRTVLDRIRVAGRAGRPRTRPGAVAADKAYSSRANRAYLRRRGIVSVIPEKNDQAANRKKKGSSGGRPVTFDPHRYKQRNTVERCFQKVKTWRGLATRYDKSPESYEAGLHLRGSIMRLKHITSTT